MLSLSSFLGTALYGYVALALRAKQWEDGSIMPVTVRGARGGITRALWLRMYAAACPGHACTATEHGRWHWEGWIHLPNPLLGSARTLKELISKILQNLEQVSNSLS